MEYPERRRSNLWYLLPIMFSIIGGAIAYFVIRKDDPAKAKYCIYLGIAFMAVNMMLGSLASDSLPGLSPGFDVNI